MPVSSQRDVQFRGAVKEPINDLMVSVTETVPRYDDER